MSKPLFGVVVTAIVVAFVLGRLSAQDVEPSCSMCPAAYIGAEEIEQFVSVAKATGTTDQQMRSIDIGKTNVQVALAHEILSKVVDGVSSGGFLSDAIDEGHAIDDLDDQLSPVQCSPLFLRGQRQLEDHR